jgi:hypothetical protein
MNASIGRIADQQGSHREGPESLRKPSLRCDLEIAFIAQRLRQTLQQRLRFGDLRHFGRRRKAFHCRREDVMGFDGVPG